MTAPLIVRQPRSLAPPALCPTKRTRTRRACVAALACGGGGGFDSLYLYTHEKMVENRALYGRSGYVQYDARAQNGMTRVFMRKRLGA